MDRMISLYDYLGHAAGKKLGREVYEYAKQKGIGHSVREVSNTSYTGKVMLYPESFLQKYFSSEPLTDLDKNDLSLTHDIDEDLPF